MEMPYHFVAPTGIFKNQKVSVFFSNCAQFLKCLSWGCPIPSNCPNQSRSQTRSHSSGVKVAVSSATLTPSPKTTTITRKAMGRGTMASDTQKRSDWGRRPALLSQPKAVDICLCSNIFTFVDVFINSPYPSTKWYSKSSTKWRCLTLAYDLVLI